MHHLRLRIHEKEKEIGSGLLKVICTALKSGYMGLHTHVALMIGPIIQLFPIIFRISGHSKSDPFQGIFYNGFSCEPFKKKNEKAHK